MSQTAKIIITIIATATVVGSGVYFWQTNQSKQTVQEESVETNSQQSEEQTVETTLTKEYLITSEWGQENSYGMQIEFNSDGTFDEYAAGETGDLSVSGKFEIKKNSVLLKVDTYAGVSFEEAKKIYESKATYIPDRTLALEKSDSSLFFTHFLANDGRIAYWNRSSKIPDGETRRYESYIVITTHPDLKPKINAKAKDTPVFYPEYPNYDGFDYSFSSCDPTCETGLEHNLSEVYKGILAKTQFKDELNGVEDYWYLAQITVPWYSAAILRKQITHVSLAWIHGSELE